MRQNVEGVLEKFKTEFKSMKNEFYTYSAVIQRYDEILSQKAGKHAIE